MKMNKYIKFCFYSILLITLIFIGKETIQAKTLGQLKSELSAAEEKYINNQNDKEQTEQQIAATKGKINELNREKIEIQNEMQVLEEELVQLGKDIEKMQKEIKSIINYYQLSSSDSIYLEYVFNSTSFTDFIYRLAVAEQLSEYRTRTINEYNNLMEQNRKKINELASKQVSLNKLEEELSIQLSNLGNELVTISDAAIDIKDEIADLKDLIKLYQDTYKCSENEELSSCETRYYNSMNSSSSMPSADGFYRPVLAGRVNADFGYTEYYGSYHYGLDVGIGHGTNVYSIASGKVIKVVYRSSCGGNMVYITHVVNGKSYTSCYAHLASINVREGQIVSYNTIIGTSGGVPSIETWDKCSTGAHLHLQIGTGLYLTDYFWYSTFQARAIDPRVLINFPAWGSYFSGR